MAANSARQADGSAGDANYGVIGASYSAYRQPEPAIAAQILEALGPARRVLNLGAGAGSYEPTDREVVAVEPSASMRVQRPPHLSVAIDAVAENLPFPDGAFEASMASFTVHQWKDLAAGLRELRRVTRGPVVILSCDPALVQEFWLNDYAPDALAAEARRYPSPSAIGDVMGGTTVSQPVMIPFACRDGFNEAYYGRPEMFLDDAARAANSAWSFVASETEKGYVAHLARDLASGAWDARHAALRTQPSYDGSLRLIVSRP